MCGPAPSFIDSIHVPLGERRGEWRTTLAWHQRSKHLCPPSLRFHSLRSLFPPSFIGLVSHLPRSWLRAGAVISQSLAMILAFHVLQDFMSDESMCSAGPCALCLTAASDARGQTAPARRACEEAFPTQRGQKTLFHRLTDLLLKCASHMRPRWRKNNTF